jgi:hypothetical protein
LAEALKDSTSIIGAPPMTPSGTYQPVAAPDLLRSFSCGLLAQYLQYKREEGIDLCIGEVPMQKQQRFESIYSPEPIGTSSEGNPVYLYQERILAEPRFVVKLPNGKAVFSDREGRINPISEGDSMMTAMFFTTFAGVLLGGTVGGLAGAGLGVAATKLWWKRRGGVRGSLHQ